MSSESMERTLTGRDAPPPTPITLRAGELRILFVDGDLRYVNVNGTEVVRRVYVGVRDLDWNTLPGEITNLEVDDREDSFQVTFVRTHRFGALEYRWLGRITGHESGRLRYEMSGEALTEFSFAKIGICVHHPVSGFAGMPFSATTPAGPVTGRLPETIGPQVHLPDGTDLPLFDPVSELRLSHSSGGSVSFAFAGDLWEVEDQRNWTDQSFKSASTPASLGYRHEAEVGQIFQQAVEIEITAFSHPVPVKSGPVRVGQPAGRIVPGIGVVYANATLPMSQAASELFTLVQPAHVRCDVDLEEEAGSQIAAASKLATELDTQIELAAFLPGGAQLAAAMTRLRAVVDETRACLARVFVFSKDAEATTPELAVQVVDELGLGSDIPVVVGTNANFNELNRNRPAAGPASGLVWAVNPQVHASDELSLVENLAAQAETVETARSFSPTLTLHVSPVTLRPRFNAVATIGEEFKPQGLPWNVDPRQTSLFAAAWTLASAAVLSTAGVDSLTYYEMVGPRGLIESPQGSIYPGQFHSLPDTAYPLALVLSDLCSLRGAEVLSVDGFDPLKLAVLACVTPLGHTVLVANLTRGEVRVDVVGLDESCRRRVLDSSTVPAATAMPSEFLGSGSSVVGSAGTIALHLGPYACARLDA